MKEREAKEETYRENWLARQSHATQAEAAKLWPKHLKDGLSRKRANVLELFYDSN